MDEQSIKKIADTISDIKNASKQQVSSCLATIQVSVSHSLLSQLSHKIVYILCVTASLVCLTFADLRTDCGSTQIPVYPVLSDLSVNLYHIFKIVQQRQG